MAAAFKNDYGTFDVYRRLRGQYRRRTEGFQSNNRVKIRKKGPFFPASSQKRKNNLDREEAGGTPGTPLNQYVSGSLYHDIRFIHGAYQSR